MPRKVDPVHPVKRLDEILCSGLRMQLAASEILHALTLELRLLQVSACADCVGLRRDEHSDGFLLRH